MLRPITQPLTRIPITESEFSYHRLNERVTAVEVIKTFTMDKDFPPHYDQTVVEVNEDGAFCMISDYVFVSSVEEINAGQMQHLTVNTEPFERGENGGDDVLIDASKYIWSKWQQPVFTDNDSWGEVSVPLLCIKWRVRFIPHSVLWMQMGDTHWEGAEGVTDVQFLWIFAQPLKIYRIELVNKPTGNIHITKSVEVYADEEMTEPLLTGEFPQESRADAIWSRYSHSVTALS